MNKGCRNCDYYLPNASSQADMCLIFSGTGIVFEKIKNGLIGKCEEFKPIPEKKEQAND